VPVYELLAGLAEPVAAVALTAFGTLVELQAAGTLGDGQTTAGLWLAAVGLVALYGGLFVAGPGAARRLRGR
jgi:hypothetical protein